MLLAKRFIAGEFAEPDPGMQKPLWLVRMLHFEYWPMWLLYLPVSPYWLWLMFKCKSIHFYKYVNPSILNGGLKDESKKQIMDDIPDEYKPVTLLFSYPVSISRVINQTQEAGISFPFIAKPDIGEQGTAVQKITSWNEMEKYLIENKNPFIIQEYVDYPVELAVFYVRYPGQNLGKVTSVTTKEFLTVLGNGTSDIISLMQQSERARFQIKRLTAKNPDQMNQVPAMNEKVILEVVGNHCKGTRFNNGNNLISDKLHAVFNTISLQVNDFFFGRYDLKVRTLEDLYEGKNIRIVELNGVGAIPAHIFDPSYKLWNAWKDIVNHWRMAGEIALLNRKAGRKVVEV